MFSDLYCATSISREVEAPLAWAFARYESSHLRWNIHTLLQASSHVQTELYIIATFAPRARTSELLFSIKTKNGEGRGVSPTTGHILTDSALNICNHRLQHHNIQISLGKTDYRVTIRFILILFQAYLIVTFLTGLGLSQDNGDLPCFL